MPVRSKYGIPSGITRLRYPRRYRVWTVEKLLVPGDSSCILPGLEGRGNESVMCKWRRVFKIIGDFIWKLVI